MFRKVKWAQRIMDKKEFEVRVVVVDKHDLSRHSCEHVLCVSKDTKAGFWHGEKMSWSGLK